MRCFLVFILGLSSFISNGQFIRDIEGKPYFEKSAQEYQGSPFLFSSWVEAKVVTATGQVYEDLLINVDLVQQLPLFVKNGKTFTFTDDITEFTLVGNKTTMLFKRGKALHKELPDVFFQVLVADPLVVKNTTKKLVESPPVYGSANIQYSFAEKTTYYASIDGQFRKLSGKQSEQYQALKQ